MNKIQVSKSTRDIIYGTLSVIAMVMCLVCVLCMFSCNKPSVNQPFVVELIVPASDNVHCNYISVADSDGLSDMIVDVCGKYSVGDTVK